jgi:uncharacterized membrane protein (Fun14 family)
MAKTDAEQGRGLTGLQRSLLALFALLLLGSAGLRLYYHQKSGISAGDLPAGATGLTGSGASAQSAEPPSGLERALPYVTESSFFGLIGFALGYASRKFIKVGLILIALFFIGLQALVWTGAVAVDWHSLVGKLNALIFNLKQDQTVTQFLTQRIPSAGGLVAGYLLGFQHG